MSPLRQSGSTWDAIRDSVRGRGQSLSLYPPGNNVGIRRACGQAAQTPCRRSNCAPVAGVHFIIAAIDIPHPYFAISRSASQAARIAWLPGDSVHRSAMRQAMQGSARRSIPYLSGGIAASRGQHSTILRPGESKDRTCVTPVEGILEGLYINDDHLSTGCSNSEVASTG